MQNEELGCWNVSSRSVEIISHVETTKKFAASQIGSMVLYNENSYWNFVIRDIPVIFVYKFMFGSALKNNGICI